MKHVVTNTTDGGVDVITIDNPPVNVLSASLRMGLKTALERAFRDPETKAVVLICAGRTFIAGADITEFGQPAQSPSFAELFDLIENGPKAVVAAIHGTALGGGFELALACHYRVATESAKLGLPEVHLGLLPGAGGTQRVPRLVGVTAALDIMTSGRQVRVAEALSLGLVDALAPDTGLREAAVAFARTVSDRDSPRPRIRDRDDLIAQDRDKPELFVDFRRATSSRFRGFKAPEAIIQAVEAAVALPFEAGLEREKQLFDELAASVESAAQRHVFFAERATVRIPDVPLETRPIDVRSVGVVGAGTMGGGIAMNFLNAGIPVTLVEMSQELLDRGIGVIRRNYEMSAAKGRLTGEEVERRMALIRPALGLDALAEADLVVEAVYESLVVKKEIFGRLDAIAKPGAILASNTSFLDLNQIAAATARPEWVIGLHFFSPANVMRLLEVVRGEFTAIPVIATAMALAKQIGKVPVLSRVCPGFIANRLIAPRGAQAEALVLEGTAIADIDKVLFDFGFAMGHFQMMDLVGLDVIGRDLNQRTVMGDLVAAGRLGQKRNGGYYDYDDKRRPQPSEVASGIVRDVASAQNVEQNPTRDPSALLDRLLFPVVNEGAKILDEQVALRAADIDIAAILGYNWPVYTGGPMFWANSVGLGRIVEGLRNLAAVHGQAFQPSPLLVRLAEQGGQF